MQTFFIEGGSFMFATTFFGFLAMATSVLTVLRPARFRAVAALLLGVTLASGVLGTCNALINTCKSMLAAEVPVEQLVQIGAKGLQESMNNLFLGLALLIPGLLVCTAAAYRAGRGSTSVASAS